jgi:hypothetical protein
MKRNETIATIGRTFRPEPGGYIVRCASFPN